MSLPSAPQVILHTVLVGVVSLFFLGGISLAQPQQTASPAAVLSGTVTDPSGAAIAGAQISAELAGQARNAVTARRITVLTSGNGAFVLSLAPGRYRIRVTHPSLQGLVQEIDLHPGEKREWSVRMRLAPMSDQVVVSSNAEPTRAETATVPVDVITQQEIAQRGQILAIAALSSSPGVSIARLGPIGGVTSLFLDGGNSNFTKVLVDGAPVNQPGGSIDWSNYTLDNVSKIEVVHGAASALDGSDALDGVIQIFSQRGTTRIPKIELLGDGGTFSSGHGLAQLSGLAGPFDYSASASYFSTDGQGQNDRFRETALSGNFGWRFDDSNNLRLTLRSNSSDAGEPGQTLLEPPILDQSAGLRNLSASLSWDAASSERWQNHLAATDSRIRELFVVPFGNTSNLFNRAGFLEQLSYLAHQRSVSLGYSYEVENGSANGPHERRNNQAGYLELRGQIGRRLSTNAGARAEANASFGTRVVPRAGMAYTLRFGDAMFGATRLRLSYGRGIKEPDFVQSFENDPCFPGNPALKPERSNTLDAGIEQYFASDRLYASLTYFHNDFGDIVSFSANPIPTSACPFGTGSFFNTDRARAFGANARLEAHPARWLRVGGNYSYDDTKVLKAPNAFDPTLTPGNRLLRRPLHSANLIVNLAARRMNWNLAGYFVGRRTDSDFLGLGITSNPSYFRLDLAASYGFGRGLSAISHFENLLDRHYQDVVGFPALGFNYRAGLKYVWGGRN